MLRESVTVEFPDVGTISAGLAADGFVYLGPDAMRRLLGAGASSGWPGFAESWSSLERDAFMGDGGQYRRRRHAIFRGSGTGVERRPGRPHFQATAFNRLNGGIARHFAPVTAEVADSPLTHRLLSVCLPAFDRGLAASRPAWDIEMHQFRIEATGQDHGLPTPEGLHRDGVDWVLMMLVNRENVTGGTTTIVDATGTTVAQLQMRQPFETIIVDDRRLRHGVSPLTALDPAVVGYRDVLVATYSAL
ncbi:2OG-Fe dioxygenase family protein [Methylobacterium brachythecii]|uniref:2OG-Fe dioxygenase family protein n=1 Tax=Methylobacterium brachythecii TaxID=1176177 RepID=UPI00160AA469